jgi:hypothetical protein
MILQGAAEPPEGRKMTRSQEADKVALTRKQLEQHWVMFST